MSITLLCRAHCVCKITPSAVSLCCCLLQPEPVQLASVIVSDGSSCSEEPPWDPHVTLLKWSCAPSGLGVGEEWHRFVYKHRDNDAQRKLQGSIVKILTGSWNVETIEELTAAQAAFTLTTVRASSEIPSQRLAHLAVMCCISIGPSHHFSPLLFAASVKALPAAITWRAQHKPSASPQTTHVSGSSGCILSRFVPHAAIKRMMIAAQ